MRKKNFQDAVFRLILDEKVRGKAREKLLEIAVNGFCYPATVATRGTVTDCTKTLLDVFADVGLPKCFPNDDGEYFACGWFIRQENGVNMIKVNYER